MRARQQAEAASEDDGRKQQIPHSQRQRRHHDDQRQPLDIQLGFGPVLVFLDDAQIAHALVRPGDKDPPPDTHHHFHQSQEQVVTGQKNTEDQQDSANIEDQAELIHAGTIRLVCSSGSI
jgi:hypothetical protein